MVSTAPVRSVTEDEVERFRRHGWVKLEQLIPEDLALRLLDRARSLVEVAEQLPSVRLDEAGRYVPGDGRPRPRDTPWWRDIYDLAWTDELFGSVAWSGSLGRNAQRLAGSKHGVRLNIDMVTCKRTGPEGPGNGPTDYHQDYPAFPFDCPGNMVFWIALDVVTPEQGAMRFLEGSHRAGALTDDAYSGDLLEKDPGLVDRFPLSEPLHYRPGDATVHHGLVVHGAPRNSAERSRWAYQVAVFTDDVLYTGKPSPRFDGIGLAPGEPFDHPRFPLVTPARPSDD